MNPLPQDRWHKADDIFKLIKQKTFVHNEVPPGDKSNSYMLVDNTRNAERFEANKICEFYDDCGVWIIEKGILANHIYYLENDSLLYYDLKSGNTEGKSSISKTRNICM